MFLVCLLVKLAVSPLTSAVFFFLFQTFSKAIKLFFVSITKVVKAIVVQIEFPVL